MKVKEAILAVLPEMAELEEVDFSKYSVYQGLLSEFAGSGRRGLVEFQRFAEEKGDKAVVGRFLLSLLQYLLIRYRRYGEYSTVKPAIKVLVTLKGWLNENGYERDWLKVLHSFVGYTVDMMEAISEKEECDVALAYLELIHNLTLEARRGFTESYYVMLEERASENLRALKEKCG
ncbi:hypothetical protein A3L12_07230 [Thermococcus sp. P6]|uniref:hypothetical protein n=1 Tax=Thermococcus sp. P6 TaxID=122420 RepID=UPI000B598E51|nr:hypothetical protein [Thermococcus sp. P6]ASJ11104.1 hypothetical protein A3L12_07230 [Thermococcus sp. P6]